MDRTKGGDALIVALVPNAFILEICDVRTSRAFPIRAVFDEGIKVVAKRIGLSEKLTRDKTAGSGPCERYFWTRATIFEGKQQLKRPRGKINRAGKWKRDIPNGMPFRMKSKRVRKGRHFAKNGLYESK